MKKNVWIHTRYSLTNRVNITINLCIILYLRWGVFGFVAGGEVITLPPVAFQSALKKSLQAL